MEKEPTPEPQLDPTPPTPEPIPVPETEPPKPKRGRPVKSADPLKHQISVRLTESEFLQWFRLRKKNSKDPESLVLPRKLIVKMIKYCLNDPYGDFR